MEEQLSFGRRVLPAALLLAFGITPLGVDQSPASVSPCPLRDPGPDSGWVRVPADFWTVMEAVEAAVQQGLHRVWIGPGRYAFSFPDSPPPILESLLLCGLGPGFTVLLHQGMPTDHPRGISPEIFIDPEVGGEVRLEGFTLVGGAVWISVERAARVTLRNLHVLGPGDLEPHGRTGITVPFVDEGAQVVLDGVAVQGAGNGLEISHVAEGEVILKRILVSGNEYGIRIKGGGRTTILESRIVYNTFSGILVDGAPRIAILNSEIAYNGGDGINGSSRLTLEVVNTRIFRNGGYGIRLFLEPCYEQWGPSWPPFEGEVRGRGNEVFDNAKGDLCPEDYPWPEGFKKGP